MAGTPPKIEIGITANKSMNGMVRFWIKDNGKGLSKEQQQALFREFARLNTQRAEGYGLGLSIVRRIINKLGGNVGVESIVGQGSTFYFELPLSVGTNLWANNTGDIE